MGKAKIFQESEAPPEVDAFLTSAANYKQVELWSLVLLAVNISHKIVQGSAGWQIFVAPRDYDLAREQLLRYGRENRGWPAVPELSPPLSPAFSWVNLFFFVALLVFYQVTGPWESGSAWFQAGALNSYRIFEYGEWWRLVCSLTLHADSVHLLGNVALGALMISYLAAQTGIGWAWLIALVAGGGANLLNAYFQGGHHLSIGFSTSVFGVIGALCALQVARRNFTLKAFLLPLGAGGGLLAMLGTEGERTDLGAHIWGLAVGLLCGLCWWRLLAQRPATAALWVQGGLVALVLGIVVLGWQLA